MGFLFFAWHPPRRFRFRFRVHPPPCPTLITPHSSQHYSSHLTHHSTTYHTTCQSHHAVTSQHYSSHHLCGWFSCGRRSTQSLLEELRRAWPPLGPRLAFVWQAHYTEPSGGAAARKAAAWAAAGFRVAGAVHKASFPTPLCHLPLCDTPSFTPLCHTLSFTHTTLPHTIFHTHNFVTPSLSHITFTHNFVIHTIFHTQLCHTLSSHTTFTHNFVTHRL